MKPENIALAEKRLGYTFKNKNLLIRALTRKAFALEQKQQGRECEDQEVYRILGDAVLKAILVEMLIEQGYNSRDAITKKKIDLENRENLGRKLQEIQLVPFIRFGLGEKKEDISKQLSVLGETFEALIAAIHVDGGSYEKTKKLVLKLFNKKISSTSIQAAPKKAIKNSDKKAIKDSEVDIFERLWMLSISCGHCVHPDICAKVGICMFDLSDSD